ncbi:hypothetical protein N656DRAFT_616478 [Canariomyces notabilis]|uniref:Uncharacterized protein n=1 Tax=Canariomyces notabilis TaxID=2074819 RepID=A0AAN6YUD1_9PEZI|nr:hypothetical protein N656DRAFT_616478 [Canariomyces arenarius]
MQRETESDTIRVPRYQGYTLFLSPSLGLSVVCPITTATLIILITVTAPFKATYSHSSRHSRRFELELLRRRRCRKNQGSPYIPLRQGTLTRSHQPVK